ncbi:reverse transcriptase [Gossypium australe]|uniref:Reverse transcriptase n=1 Tax=Gossypium australe TaxID=47621 RepID=A0A5B6VJ07_9ROSI|nr:reverse transcriptase [Gossypium australe]
MVALNCEDFGLFILYRGINQDGPLPHHLFIMCVKKQCGALHGIAICQNNPNVSHFLFVGDGLFFFHAKKYECQVVKNILTTYEVASRQAVNFQKFDMLFSSNTPSTNRAMAHSILGVRKEIVFKTIAHALSVYWLSIFLLPIYTCLGLQ